MYRIRVSGVMGVPISFMTRYNPKQFAIVGWSRRNDIGSDAGLWRKGCADATLKGHRLFRRMMIINIAKNNENETIDNKEE